MLTIIDISNIIIISMIYTILTLVAVIDVSKRSDEEETTNMINVGMSQ